jgi:hypothetical protein
MKSKGDDARSNATEFVGFKLTPEQREKLEKDAADSKLKLSDYIKYKLELL